MYEIDEFVKTASCVMDNICRYVAFLNEAEYLDNDTINLSQDKRFISIGEQKTIEGGISTRFVPQRREEWHALRNKAKVTGSTLYKAVGCDGLGKQKDYFEKLICGVAEKEPSDFVKQAMQHGIDNEENAVGTIVGKVLPVLTPNLHFCEEGCVVVNNAEGDIFMVVSPDGSLRKNTSLASSQVAIEIKCPTRRAHTEFPGRYMLQCLSEIYALEVEYLIYVSWTESVTTVFKVSRNDELLRNALKISMDLYGIDRPKKPTRQTQSTKDLKVEIERESKSVEFIGRFPSCKVSNAPNEYDKDEKTNESICQLLTDICECYKACHELQRERATEAVVFLVADLDRSWKKNTVRCSPVGWFPKGYSLDTGTMRDIAEEVHTLCTKGGIHVPCESFDGQWHLLVVRDASGQPLTLLQLQKDVWKNAERKSKKEIIDELKQLNKSVTWSLSVDVNPNTVNRKYLTATNGGLTLPKYRYVKTTNKKNVCKAIEYNIQTTTLMESVPDSVRETADIGMDVMSMNTINDVLEMEAFIGNINEEVWSQEMQSSAEENILDETEDTECISNTNVDHGCQTINNSLDLSDMECILSMLKTTKDCNKKMQWNSVLPTDLFDYFSCYDKMNKLLNVEVRVIVRYLKKAKGMIGVKESSTKKAKLEAIAKFLTLNIPDNLENTKGCKKACSRAVSTLRDIATKALSKCSKQELNVIIAEYNFVSEYESWIKPVKDTTVNDERREWFYKPEYSTSRQQVEVKCIDSTHLLTRARRKTCTGGIEGITNEAWTKVAKQKSTLLTPIMVEDISDPMSVSMAKTHFSLSVEIEMRKNGDIKAADLCNDIRNWWESEDSPGIAAASRIEKRQSLRRRLMSKVNFARFPPPTQYVSGWPVQLWESLIASIDAKAYLYAMAHGSTYNVRAFSSLIGETFFSELTLNDKRGQGTVSALEFGQYMGHSTEQLQVRLDQDRKFAFCTSKTKVYDVVDESYVCESGHEHDICRICNGEKAMIPQTICTRDHPFDTAQRKRLDGRRNRDHVPTERNALLKGSLGVRWEKARPNMSKMWPTKRMGIPDNYD